MDFRHFINHFIALLVVANPLSALPAVLRLTRRLSLAEKKRTGLACAFAVGVILVSVTWIGTPLLLLFGIKLEAFQVAGGLIILLLALSMLNAEESSLKQNPDETISKDSFLVPLAIPIIAGPGAISTIIVSVNEYPGLINQLILTASAILVALAMGIILYFAASLEEMLGQSGINIINRIGGLLLAAIAIQTLASGLASLFPGLMGAT